MSALSAIHVAKKQLGLDDDTYRAALVQVTGKGSTKDMSETERRKVVEHFRNKGFAAAPAKRKRLEGKYAPVLQALWIGGWNLGIVRNADDASLLAFVKRQTGIDHVRFLRDQDDAMKAIEALKGWMHREAGVDWSKGKFIPDWQQTPAARIAVAQFEKLSKAGHPVGLGSFTAQVEERSGKSIRMMETLDWQQVSGAFGKLIREDKKAGKAVAA